METQKENKLHNFLLLINSLINRPAMYGVNNVENLYLVMFGYNMAFEGSDIDDLLYEFRKFINQDFASNSDYDWVRLIRFYSGGDRHSLELFKNKFNSFLKQKEINFEIGAPK